MKAKEIRGMSLNEAQEKVLSFRADLAKERAVLASGTRPENPGKIRFLRRNIARVLTIMLEKQKKGEKIIERKEEKKPAKEAEKKQKKPEAKKTEKKKEPEKKAKKTGKVSKKK